MNGCFYARPANTSLRLSVTDLIAFLLVGLAFASVIILFVADRTGSPLDLIWHLFRVKGF